ncbi:hypothetical protein [Thermococcus sp. 21S7]|uniref:hypothetical protein n=1 Tax=Thermococcus sp. 21S7 TaxID=1638221 RepID=UPI00143BE71D|nr:hypothetical protein [Thermococcus sp. 21S7]NJE60722.1 hypothetical protein [Thermococcus sp. 21S7]
MTTICGGLRSPAIREFCYRIVQLARESGGYFEPIAQEFLDEYYRFVEVPRIRGTLPDGEYRQKGNAFRDFISELIFVRSDHQYRLVDKKVQGYTERNHDVDLAYVVRGTVLVAGEVKMTGSPSHRRGNYIQKERKTQSDLDKRLKEVKFTAVDLKLRHTPNDILIKITSNSTPSSTNLPLWWDEWIKTSVPGFYSFWASRLASGQRRGNKTVNADNPSLLLEKFDKLRKYNNAVGVFMFREEGDRYVPVEEERIGRLKLKIDEAIDDLINFLDAYIGSAL